MGDTSPPFDAPPELVHVPREIRTDRLVIRPWTPDDAEAVFTAIDASRETLAPWLPWVDSHLTLEQQHVNIVRFQGTWLTREDLPLGVLDHDGAVLGGSGLHRMDWKLRSFEIGYWLASSAVGRGVMSECVAAVTRMAFDALDAQRVEIRMDSRNTRSRSIPERLGFRHEGTLRASALAVDGSVRDTDIFALVRGDELPSDDAAGHARWS